MNSIHFCVYNGEDQICCLTFVSRVIRVNYQSIFLNVLQINFLAVIWIKSNSGTFPYLFWKNGFSIFKSSIFIMGPFPCLLLTTQSVKIRNIIKFKKCHVFLFVSYNIFGKYIIL